MVSFVPVNAISRTQILSGVPHSCNGFVDAVLGLVFCVYWFDSHSSMIPFARSSLDIVFEFANWSILMPVAWCVALASSLFPPSMRSMKASRRVCIHPHSVVVSSLRPLGDDLLLNIGLTSRRVLQSFWYFAMA